MCLYVLSASQCLLSASRSLSRRDAYIVSVCDRALCPEIAVFHAGFVDPAYQQTGRLDASSDGYALGVCLLMCITGWPALDISQREPVLVNRCHEVLTFSGRADDTPSDQSIREIADLKCGWPCAVLKALLAVSAALLHPLRARRKAVGKCLQVMELISHAHGLPVGLVQADDDWYLLQPQHGAATSLWVSTKAAKDCVMCLERCRQVRFDLCGHAVLCAPCHQQLLAASSSPACPVCGGHAAAVSEPSDEVARQETFVRARTRAAHQ